MMSNDAQLQLLEAISAVAILLIAIVFVSQFTSPPSLPSAIPSNQLKILGDEILRDLDQISSGHGTSLLVDYMMGNSSLFLDGDGDYVDCGNDSSLNVTSGVTVEAWVKTSAASGERFIVTKWKGFSLESYRSFATKGRFCVYVEGATRALNFNTNYVDGLWHHIAASYNASSGMMKVYVDGVEDNSKTLTDLSDYNITTSESHLLIGSFFGNYFEGNIDDVRVYSRELTSDEILSNYHGMVTTVGLVSEWRFDGGSNDAVVDSWGDNDGTFNGDAKKEFGSYKYFPMYIEDAIPSDALYTVWLYNASLGREDLWYPWVEREGFGEIVRCNRVIVYDGFVYDVVLKMWYI